MEDNISINNHGFETEHIEKLLDDFSDIGMIPISDKDWNIAEIVLSCVNSEAYLSGMKKRFVINDIKTKNISVILKSVDWDIKTLMKFHVSLLRATEPDPNEEERTSIEKKDSGDICDNCGFLYGISHDCMSAIENRGEKLLGDDKDIESLTVDDLTYNVAETFKIMKIKVTYTYMEPKNDAEAEEQKRNIDGAFDIIFKGVEKSIKERNKTI
jgi:hypothetical protein